MNIPENVRIRKVERIGALDRFGTATRTPVLTDIGAFLRHADFVVRGANGDSKQVDAVMRVQGCYDIRSDDLITLDAPKTEQYKVFQAREVSDATGVMVARSLNLVKQVYTGSA